MLSRSVTMTDEITDEDLEKLIEEDLVNLLVHNPYRINQITEFTINLTE